MQKIINDKFKTRPNTTKANYENKPRPFSSVRPKTGLDLNNKKKEIIEENNIKNLKNIPAIQIQTKNFNIITNKNCRLPRPCSSYKDKIFNKYWDGSMENKLNSVDVKIDIKSNKINSIVEQENLNNGIFNRNLYKFPKINWDSKKVFNFLTTIGGSEMETSQYRNNLEMNGTITTEFSSRPTSGNIGNFTQNNSHNSFVNSNIKTLIGNKRPVTSKEENNKRLISGKLNKPIRPMTAINKNGKFRPMSGKINIESQNKINITENDNSEDEEELLDDIIDEIVEESISMNRITENKSNLDNLNNSNNSNISNNFNETHPKLFSLLNNYKKINPKGSSIKIQVADSDLLDIFDRSQRTRAATLSKIGDYEYYSSYQRIGSFMDYSEHLKLADLKNIEKNIKYLDKNRNFINKKTKTQNDNNNSINKSQLMRDPNSLFHGFMRFEENNERIVLELGKDNRTYDPVRSLPKCFNEEIHDPKNWSPEFINQVTVSINNYEKYLKSDKILITDIIPFNKKQKKRFLSHFSINLMRRHKRLIEITLIEIEREFYYTMKNVIMEYILRSPFERKRLNIQFLPQKQIPSSYIIAEHGSFNKTLYSDWVENYSKAQDNLIKNLSICNIISSTLCDWTQSFRHVDLLYVKGVKRQIGTDYGTIHINDFFNNEITYLKKSSNFLRDIYYRGALLITKKNKTFKRKFNTEGKWTFKGFLTKENVEEYLKSQINHSTYETQSSKLPNDNLANSSQNDDIYGMDFTDGIEDFWSNVETKDLIDIRVNASYFAYVTLLKKSKIDLNSNEYDLMSVDEQVKLNSSVSTYITVFLRGVVEKSVENLCDFIQSFKFNDEIFSELEFKKDHKFYDLNNDIYYKEKEIKLPNLRAFMIKEYVKPLLNIKTKNDLIYNFIKFEYTPDQVIEYFTKLIDQSVVIFNSLYTTHFLEFKHVLPDDHEIIQKEHWSRLYDIFLETKNELGKFSEDYFANFLPMVIIQESKNYMKSNLRVGLPYEEIFMNFKNKISKNIKIHFIEMEECLKLFEPIKELIHGILSENVNGFLENIINIPDYNKYTNYIEKIRTFQRYITTIPNFISYSLFSIDTRETKSELLKKLNELLISLFKSLEDQIINLYGISGEKYIKLHRQIDKKLSTPEELVEMERTKNEMLRDLSLIQKDFDDAMKIYLFLLSINHIFSDLIILKTEEIFKRHFRFKKDLEEIEKNHHRDKDQLENKFKEDKLKIDQEVQEYVLCVNKFDNEIHIVEYEQVLIKIEEIENIIPQLTQKIERICLDEELLFSYKTISYEENERANNKLNKLTFMWKKAAIFYELRKQILTNFSENIDLINSMNAIKEISYLVNNNRSKTIPGEEVIMKLSKILEDDIEVFKDFLEVTNDVISSDSNLEENLKSKVLNLLDSKKLETACKNILYMCYSKKS